MAGYRAEGVRCGGDTFLLQLNQGTPDEVFCMRFNLPPLLDHDVGISAIVTPAASVNPGRLYAPGEGDELRLQSGRRRSCHLLDRLGRGPYILGRLTLSPDRSGPAWKRTSPFRSGLECRSDRSPLRRGGVHGARG